MVSKAAFRCSIIRSSNSPRRFLPTSNSRPAIPSICSNARWVMSCRSAILNRRDKMGFPVPLKEWFGRSCANFVQDLFRSQPPKPVPFLNTNAVLANFDRGWSFLAQNVGFDFA